MKKLICLLLALLTLSSCTALAAGRIEIRRQSLFLDPDQSNNFYFAELETLLFGIVAHLTAEFFNENRHQRHENKHCERQLEIDS